MIRKIKDSINSYVNSKLGNLLKNQKEANQIQFNYSQLSQLFTDTSFYLPITIWSMSPSTITHVLNDIVISNRKCIIEFGSGMSTIYIAKLLKANKINASFYSVESNMDWSNKITKQLELLGLSAYVTIINAPIRPVNKSFALGEQKLWYDVNILNEHLKAIDSIDLVLVDGPFGGLTPYARFSAVPYLKDKLVPNCSVFLDDIHRKEEQSIIKSWESTLGCQAKFIERYAILSTNKEFDTRPFQF